MQFAHSAARLKQAGLDLGPSLPDFVEQRMEEHYVTRIAGLLGGQHPHKWQPLPAEAIFLAGNDYLSLTGEGQLLRAQMKAMAAAQDSMLMSAVFLQDGSAQHRLEHRLARFVDAENGVVTQSGWAANVGLVQCLAGPGIPVYLDLLAHASLWEGALSAQARAVSFLHNDLEHLQRQLKRYGPGVIAIDALYSTNGSLAPLAEVVDIAERSGCIVIVDESHSLGTHGPCGAGLVVAAGLADRVHFRTASLAKAFAGRAGFISCSSRFKGYFLSESRPAIFSSSLLAHELAWFDAALDFIAAADGRRDALRSHTRRVREGLAQLGYNVEGSEQIIALEAGAEPKTLLARRALERHGIYGAMFCAPATAKNRSLVRLTLNAGLASHQVDQLLSACALIREEADVENWSSTRRSRRLSLV
jgi:CAI-1 autoinducer synthase